MTIHHPTCATQVDGEMPCSCPPTWPRWRKIAPASHLLCGTRTSKGYLCVKPATVALTNPDARWQQVCVAHVKHWQRKGWVRVDA